MILPYVYKLTHKTTNHYYIGVRWANKAPSSQDLGVLYFTSSKYIKPRFSEFYIEILAEFFHKDDAFSFEQQTIKECYTDKLCLNIGIFGTNIAPDNSKSAKLGGIALWTKYKTDQQFKQHISDIRKKQSLNGKNPMQNKKQSIVTCLHCKKQYPVNIFKRHTNKISGGTE